MATIIRYASDHPVMAKVLRDEAGGDGIDEAERPADRPLRETDGPRQGGLLRLDEGRGQGADRLRHLAIRQRAQDHRPAAGADGRQQAAGLMAHQQ